MYAVTFPITPVAKGRPRFTRRGFAYTPEKTRKAEADLKTLMLMSRPPKIFDCPIVVAVTFHLVRPKSSKALWPSVRPDVDNLAKWVKDAGNGILWKDDSLICVLRAEKIYSERAMVSIQIEEL